MLGERRDLLLKMNLETKILKTHEKVVSVKWQSKGFQKFSSIKVMRRLTKVFKINFSRTLEVKWNLATLWRAFLQEKWLHLGKDSKCHSVLMCPIPISFSSAPQKPWKSTAYSHSENQQPDSHQRRTGLKLLQILENCHHLTCLIVAGKIPLKMLPLSDLAQSSHSTEENKYQPLDFYTQLNYHSRGRAKYRFFPRCTIYFPLIFAQEKVWNQRGELKENDEPRNW